jgi:hypothetical protein
MAKCSTMLSVALFFLLIRMIAAQAQPRHCPKGRVNNSSRASALRATSKPDYENDTPARAGELMRR